MYEVKRVHTGVIFDLKRFRNIYFHMEQKNVLVTYHHFSILARKEDGKHLFINNTRPSTLLRDAEEYENKFRTFDCRFN